MKCSFCGQEIKSNNKFCPNCGQEHVVVETETQNEPMPTNVAIDKSYGFKNALTATILGACSFISIFITSFLLVIAPVVGVMFLIAGTVVAIIGIIKGVKGIKDFIFAKKQANAKPVATLVLGICGIDLGASTIIYGLFTILFTAIGLLLYF